MADVRLAQERLTASVASAGSGSDPDLTATSHRQVGAELSGTRPSTGHMVRQSLIHSHM